MIASVSLAYFLFTWAIIAQQVLICGPLPRGFTSEHTTTTFQVLSSTSSHRVFAIYSFSLIVPDGITSTPQLSVLIQSTVSIPLSDFTRQAVDPSRAWSNPERRSIEDVSFTFTPLPALSQHAETIPLDILYWFKVSPNYM